MGVFNPWKTYTCMLCRSSIDKFVMYMCYTLGTYFTPKFLAYYTLILEGINRSVKKLLLYSNECRGPFHRGDVRIIVKIMHLRTKHPWVKVLNFLHIKDYFIFKREISTFLAHLRGRLMWTFLIKNCTLSSLSLLL